MLEPTNGSQPAFKTHRWQRTIRDDPRIARGDKDLAYEMSIASDAYGRCDATIQQLQRWMGPDPETGQYVNERTIKRRRKRLVDLGYMELVRKGGVGVGRGFGSAYQLSWPSEKGDTSGPRKGTRKGTVGVPLSTTPLHTNLSTGKGAYGAHLEPGQAEAARVVEDLTTLAGTSPSSFVTPGLPDAPSRDATDPEQGRCSECRRWPPTGVRVRKLEYEDEPRRLCNRCFDRLEAEQEAQHNPVPW